MPWLFFLVMIALVVTLHVDMWDEEDPKDRSVLSGQRETIQGSTAPTSGGSSQTEDYGRIPLRLRRRKNEKEELSVQDVSLEREALGTIDVLDIVPEELLHIHSFYPEGRASYAPYVGSGDIPPADAPLRHDNLVKEETMEEAIQDTSTPTHAQPVLQDKGVGTDTLELHEVPTQTQPLPEKIEKSIGTEAFLPAEIPTRDQETQTNIYVHEAGTQKDVDSVEQGTMTENPVMRRFSLQPLSILPLTGKRVQDMRTDPEDLEEVREKEEEELEKLPPLHSVSPRYAPLSPSYAPLHSLDISAFFKKHALENEEEIVKSEEVSKGSSFLSSSSEEEMQESVVIEDKEMILKRLFPQKLLEKKLNDHDPKLILNVSGTSLRKSKHEASEGEWEKILGPSHPSSQRSIRSMSFEFIGEKEELEDHEKGKSLEGGMILNFKKKMERSESYEVME